MNRPLSEQLADAVNSEVLSSSGFRCKLLRLTHENYPGKAVHGVLPLVVIGHEALTDVEWGGWLRENATAAYGTAYAQKLVETGVDLKAMLPTAPIGRLLRISKEAKWISLANRYQYVNEAGAILTLVEKWPSLYNLMAEEMAEEEMTLETFVERVKNMPTPWEIGQGRDLTLGDLIGRGVVLTPNW
ncbi:MAG: hypothetical protein JRG69_08820 [Deltaproteobacteria bacterium]|nr:hypothetical protein [Deltaproteobacteria bacterium]